MNEEFLLKEKKKKTEIRLEFRLFQRTALAPTELRSPFLFAGLFFHISIEMSPVGGAAMECSHKV